jgi:hypothetical protein
MELCLESGVTSLNKAGEELCGDKVETALNGENMTLVLADGLGSGVKANILATLTSKILCTMVSNGIELEECVNTIIQTLPVCKVRGVAYSTFTVVHVDNKGEGYLFEFDNPASVYYHNGVCREFERTCKEYCGKTVYTAPLKLEKGDVIIMMSDGVVHAGIGKILNLGWQRDDIIKYLDKNVTPEMSAKGIACMLAAACNDLYVGSPGDDTTAAAVKIREKQNVRLMIGPPADRERADFFVQEFISGDGKKAVCGGTTSQIVAKYLDRPLETEFACPDKDVPPIGHIEGIDLTTEGVLTLRKLLELSERYLSENNLEPKRSKKADGASLLANMLFEEATDVTFFVGQSINPAHQGLPIDSTMKFKLVEAIAENLKKMGKNVIINYD